MKTLVAAIALLCLSSTVLAHDIYSKLRGRDGSLCCNGQDCKPVEATVLPNGNYYLPASNEIIPAEMATPSPDDRFHRCAYPQWAPPKPCELAHIAVARPHVTLMLGNELKSAGVQNESRAGRNCLTLPFDYRPSS